MIKTNQDMNFKGFMLFLGIRAILGNVAKRPISCFLQEGACGYKMKAEAIFFAGENRTCVVKGWQQLCAVVRAFIPIGYRQPNRPAERDLLRKRRAAA